MNTLRTRSSFRSHALHALLLSSIGVCSLVAYTTQAQEERLMAPPPTHEEPTLNEVTQNRFINLVRNSTALMEGSINRLSQIAVRIESRVQDLEAKGVNTELVRGPLDSATAKLIEAGQGLTSTKAQAESALLSDASQSRFLVAYREYKDIETLIFDALLLLQEALAELRDAVAEAEINGDVIVMGNSSTVAP